MDGDGLAGLQGLRPDECVLPQLDPRASLRAFVQSGRTTKETAESLVNFCCEERGPWMHSDNDNNAAPLTSPSPTPTGSPGMSTSSLRSFQHPPTQPQTPTDQSQQYRLDHDQQLQDDYIELKAFLLRLLAPATGLGATEHERIQGLYDMSSMSGHGTRKGFEQLVKEAATVATVTKSFTGSISHAFGGSALPQQSSPSSHAATLVGHGQAPYGYQQSQPLQNSSHNNDMHFALAPDLGRQMRHFEVDTRSQVEQRGGRYLEMQTPADQLQIAGSPAPLFGSISLPTRQGENSSAASLLTDAQAALVPNRIRRLSRQKEESDAVSAAQASQTRTAPKPSKNAASRSDQRQPELQTAECTIVLENGQPCDWRAVADKAYRAGLDHIREHHPREFNERLMTCPSKAAFEAMVHRHVVIECPLNKKNALERCGKVCAGEQMYRSMIEHVRRAHCQPQGDGDPSYWANTYVLPVKTMRPDLNPGGNGLKSNKETLELVCQIYRRREGLERHRPHILDNFQTPAAEHMATSPSTAEAHFSRNTMSPDATIHSPSTLPPQQVPQFLDESFEHKSHPSGCVQPASLQVPTGQMGQKYGGFQAGYHQQASHSLSDTPVANNMSTSRVSSDYTVQEQHGGLVVPGSTIHHTLGQPLFPCHDPDVIEHHFTPVIATLRSYGSSIPLQPHPIGHGEQQFAQGVNRSLQSVEGAHTSSVQGGDWSPRKRKREDTDGVEGEAGALSKRAATELEPALLSRSASTTDMLEEQGFSNGESLDTTGNLLSIPDEPAANFMLWGAYDALSFDSLTPVDGVVSSEGIPAFHFDAVELSVFIPMQQD